MCLTVRLGNTLELVLLLDGVAVGGALGGVDKLVGEALADGLDVAEGRHARTRDEQVDGLVDATQRRHVTRLSSHGTGRANTCRVLARATVDDGVDQDLSTGSQMLLNIS